MVSTDIITYYYIYITTAHHHTYIIKLMSIAALYINYITHSNLITSSNSITFYTLITSLHHSCIPPISPVTIYLRISTGIQFPHSAPIFLSPFQKFVPIIILNNLGIFQNYCFSLAMSRLIQGRVQLTRIQSFVVYVLQKLIEGFKKILLLRVQRQTVMNDAIKPAMA